jgi:hypothetical protein
MSRYKGRISFKAIERDFPHHVDMPVPEGGLGKKLEAMYVWHLTRGIPAMHGPGRRTENGRDIIRWCLAADLANAEASLDHLIRGSRGFLADILLAVAPKTGERR